MFTSAYAVKYCWKQSDNSEPFRCSSGIYKLTSHPIRAAPSIKNTMPTTINTMPLILLILSILMCKLAIPVKVPVMMPIAKVYREDPSQNDVINKALSITLARVAL